MPGGLAVTQPLAVGLGEQYPFLPASPSAGANFSYKCDGLGMRRFLSLVFTLTTSNAVASRLVSVELQGSDGLAYSVSGNAVAVVASKTQRFAGALGGAVSGTSGTTDLYFPLDPVFMAPGDTLAIVVGAIDTADTLTKIRGVYELFRFDAAWLPADEP